jgi:serine/threonine protein kinase
MLIADRSRRKEMKRVISLHVGSRWYRAPEISLVEKSYDQSADLWSLGCIIYELLMYISFTGTDDKFKTDFQKARYLFQGNSCFPLSPFGKKEKGEKDDKGR